MRTKNPGPTIPDLFLASNLQPVTTGVEGAVIWIFAGEFTGVELGPRILVVIGGDKMSAEWLLGAVSVRLTTPPEVVGELPCTVWRHVIEFVEKNRNVLLQHWNGVLASKETLDFLQRI
jgi:hypothetical protein